MRLVRFPVLVLIFLSGASTFAQDTTTAAPPPPAAPTPTGNPVVTLASEFFENNFVNLYAFGDGIYDSYAPIEQNGRVSNSGSMGWDVGGGINAYHRIENGDISVTYRGDYRYYQSSLFGTGTDQYLSFGYNKRLSRRWSLNVGLGGGIFLYGETFISPLPTQSTVVQANPFSNESRFAYGGVSLSYMQTRRLSYSVSGNFLLNRYSLPGSVGMTGITGSGGVQYRLSARTTVGGSYSHSYFAYQGGSGQADINSFSGTVARALPNHWNVSAYGGVSRSTTSGVIAVPVTLLLSNGQAVGGYLIGPYKRTSNVPSFGGSVSRTFHHSLLSVSAGQGISAGNGYYLSSRSDFVTGTLSYSKRKSNISAGGSYSLLSSIANTVTSKYRSAGLSVSYSRNLVRFVGMNIRYDYIYYQSLSPFPGTTDNRISFGFNFSSKSIPLTLY